MGREGGWTGKEWNRGVPLSPGHVAGETISEQPFLMIPFVRGTHVHMKRYIFSVSNDISIIMAKDRLFRTVYVFLY